MSTPPVRADAAACAGRDRPETPVGHREHIESLVRALLNQGVPLRAVAPILAHVDPSRCESCGRKSATDDDWKGDIPEGERDDLCWGTAANCELDFEGDIW